MSELPKGWVIAPLKSLLSSDGIFSDGDWIESKDQDPNGSIRLLQLADIGDGYFVDKSSRFVNEEKFAALNCTELKTGDILIARMPDPLGRACLLPEIPQPCITVVDVAVFRAGKAGASNKWLMNAINSPQLRAFMEINSSGTTRKRIARGKLADMELPVPPLNEQNRIADKLDAVLARVNACLDRLDHIPVILKRFRQSVLAAATSGKLTEEWRDENGIQLDEWRTRTGAETFSFITSGSRGWASYYSDSGSIFLRIGNLDHLTIALDLSEIQYVKPPAGAEGIRTRVQLNDILISITADVGMVGLVSEPLGDAYINQHICLARPKPEHSPRYLAYFLASPTGGLGRLQDLSRGATKVGLTLGDIRELEIQLPSLDEQTEIVRRVEALFAYADRMDARYQTARAQVDELTPALLAKAFRGEIVPQDPNDEPASALLEHIRMQRSNHLKEKSKPKPKPSVTRTRNGVHKGVVV